MKTLLAASAVVLFASVCAYAQEPAQAPEQAQAPAAKSCDELKAEIEKKLEAKGVRKYTLEIVDKEAEAEGKVVGACGGQTKKIVYTRGGASEQSAAKKSEEPKE